jgi:hypothetical protein
MARTFAAQITGIAGQKPGTFRPGQTRLGRAVFALVSILGLTGLLSCGSAPVSTQNASTLWVNFGQSELDLILVESEPPYY